MINKFDIVNEYRTFHFQKRQKLNDFGWKIEILDMVGGEKSSNTVNIDTNVFIAQFCIWDTGELNFEYLLIEKPKHGHFFHYEIENSDELRQKLSEAYAILEGIKKRPHSYLEKLRGLLSRS